ncbi:MAG: hypothetical protein AABX48_04385 [Nanoarchaeota archaeon]
MNTVIEHYREVMNDLERIGIKSHVIYTGEEGERKIKDILGENYKIERVPLSEVPESLRDIGGVRITKLEKVVTQ